MNQNSWALFSKLLCKFCCIAFLLALPGALVEARAVEYREVDQLTRPGTSIYGGIFGADWGGGKIAVSGNNLIIGEYVDRNPSALIYQPNAAGKWSIVASVSRYTDGGSGAAPSVAIDGPLAAVGMQLDDMNGAYAGSVSVLYEFAGQWIVSSPLVAPDGAPGDSFGARIAVNDSRILVGAPGVGSEYTDRNWSVRRGAAYLFESDAVGQWHPVAKFSAGDGKIAQSFGSAVAISGSTAMVGASASFKDAVLGGAIYVYRDIASNDWREVDKIYPSDPHTGGRFGHAISMNDSTMLVGAPGSYNPEWKTPGGAAYILKNDGSGKWNETAILRPSSQVELGFGSSVALHGSLAIVGADGNAFRSGDRPSSVYVFQDDGMGNWNQIAKMSSDETTNFERLGLGVATNGETLFVAARRTFSDGITSSHVHVLVPEPSSLGLAAIAAIAFAMVFQSRSRHPSAAKAVDVA